MQQADKSRMYRYVLRINLASAIESTHNRGHLKAMLVLLIFQSFIFDRTLGRRIDYLFGVHALYRWVYESPQLVLQLLHIYLLLESQSIKLDFVSLVRSIAAHHIYCEASHLAHAKLLEHVEWPLVKTLVEISSEPISYLGVFETQLHHLPVISIVLYLATIVIVVIVMIDTFAQIIMSVVELIVVA